MSIIPAFPYNLVDGTLADAGQVMADLDLIQSAVNANAAANGANSDITSLSGLTTPLSVGQGGTGNTTGQPSGAAGGALGGTYPNPVFANAGNLTVMANITGGSAAPSATAISAFSLKLSPFGGDTGSGGTVGAVPAPAAGDAAAGKVLGAGGTWVTNTAGVPPGTIAMFVGPNPPAGYLACNGAAVSRTTYSALNTLANAVGYAAPWGAGDGSTTFNVPNFLGQFPRGYDSGGSVDPGRTFGTTQTDAMQGHLHSPPSGSLAYFAQVSSSTESTEAGSNATFDDKFAATGAATTDGSHGTPRVASETRPTNVAVLFIIKT